MLRAGAPVNCRVTEDSSTPLHKACAGSKPGHLSAVKQLLDGGADVHALNKWRETPLLTAANHGQAGAVDALLKAGADPCKCTDTGWSPLSIAAYKGHDSVVRLLLEEGAPTEEADPTLSALLQAATKGLPDTVELLLRHGADHTVTTKKGDTALSILVEQNLIDAAVEMVTEYKASVPRCSRDRKKVQRARLLINLRMKQHEREGKHLTVATDDDETDDEDMDDLKSAQHDDSSPAAAAPVSKQKKGKGPKLSAEEHAKAAEEALLRELEQEDAKAKKDEADANSKRAKKKKKKERERQQKMKEDEEQRIKEEKEAKKREQLRKEKEEKDTKERQQKLREQREKEMKAAAEREKKRTEKEEREKKQRELEQKHNKKVAASPTAMPVTPNNRGKAKGKVTPNKKSTTAQPNGAAPVPAKEAVTPVANAAAGKAAGQVKNRGWETKGKPVVKQPEASKPAVVQQQPVANQNAGSKAVSRAPAKETPAQIVPPPATTTTPVGTPSSSTFNGQSTSDYAMNQQGRTDMATVGNNGFSNSSAGREQQAPSDAAVRNAFAGSDGGLRMNFSPGAVEHPAVELFRREKLTELMQRCRLALSVVDELALKRVLYRWIVRAAHSNSSYMDCIIPSWVDYEQLVTFFQRQFIAESRKGGRGSTNGTGMINMETLREAGSSMANLCHSQAKEIVQFRLRMEEQLPRDWTDAALLMTAADARNGNEIGVVVDWANRSKVYLPGKEFTALRTRYVGPPNRFLTSLFAVKSRYETKGMLLRDSNLDFYLAPATKICLSSEASVSAELWSDPLTALESNVFWGNFEDVDKLFGGVVPFGKDDGGSEELLSRHGGSVCVLLPFDNMVASRYMRRMLDLLEDCDPKGVPVSFVTFIHADSFHDLNGPPSMNDLHLFDPRLGDNSKQYLRQIEPLAPGQHLYQCAGVSTVSAKGSLLVLLQNEAARASFVVSEGSMAKIRQSMSTNVPATSGLSMPSPMGFNGNGDYQPKQSPGTPSSGYFDGLPPISPTPQQPVFMDFGSAPVGGNDISNAFSPSPSEARRSAPPRRGRLFELVDDGEPEHLNDVDVVSGMLNNLNVDLFQNNVSQDVDIEAISLMGIGGPPNNRQMPPGNSHSHPTHSRFA